MVWLIGLLVASLIRRIMPSPKVKNLAFAGLRTRTDPEYFSVFVNLIACVWKGCLPLVLYGSCHNLLTSAACRTPPLSVHLRLQTILSEASFRNSIWLAEFVVGLSMPITYVDFIPSDFFNKRHRRQDDWSELLLNSSILNNYQRNQVSPLRMAILNQTILGSSL